MADRRTEDPDDRRPLERARDEAGHGEHACLVRELYAEPRMTPSAQGHGR